MNPQEQLTPLLYPARGIDVAAPFSLQPPETTPAGVNTRTFEALTGRARGGSRHGISRYVNQSLGGAIQDVNSVLLIESGALPPYPDYARDLTQTTITAAGTYVLLYFKDTSTPWKVSQVIGVDANGVLHVGIPQPAVGTPGDGQVPAVGPIALPANYYVLSYWAPGAWPLLQGDWQNGHAYPGFGWWKDVYPYGFVESAFGYPYATVLDFTLPVGNAENPAPLPSDGNAMNAMAAVNTLYAFVVQAFISLDPAIPSSSTLDWSIQAGVFHAGLNLFAPNPAAGIANYDVIEGTSTHWYYQTRMYYTKMPLGVRDLVNKPGNPWDIGVWSQSPASAGQQIQVPFQWIFHDTMTGSVTGAFTTNAPASTNAQVIFELWQAYHIVTTNDFHSWIWGNPLRKQINLDHSTPTATASGTWTDAS